MSIAVGMDAMRYAASSARVKGLQAQLLSDDTWQELLIAADMQSVLDALRYTAYAGILQELQQTPGISLEGIERRLTGHAAANVRRAMAFTRGAVRQLLLVWWQHYELENLKAVFRGVHERLDPATIQGFLIPLGDDSTLPFDTLLHEGSITSLIDRLADTHYINPLRNAFPAYQRERSLFPLEVALDIRYYRDVGFAVKHLGGAEREDARRLLSTRLDMLNILWAFRYRVFHGLSAEEIVNYTLWHTVHTDTDLIRDIALGAEPHAILARVWGAGVVDTTLLDAYTDEFRMLPRLEMTLERYWRKLALRELHGYPFRLGTILAYLILEEMEVRDLVTLLESKRMGWEADRVSEHLVRGKE